MYLNRAYAPLAKRLEGYIGYARAIPEIAADIRANLKTPLPQSFMAARHRRAFGGFAGLLPQRGRADVRRGQGSGRASASWREADAAAAQAMEELKSWLEGERRHATQAFALGEPLFLEMLKVTERVDVPLSQLLRDRQADLERNTAALRQACATYLPHGTLAACVRKMNANKPRGRGRAGRAGAAAQLRAFVVQKQHRQPCRARSRRRWPRRRPTTAPTALTSTCPAPTSKDVAYVYNIAPPDPAWSARERAAYVPGQANLLYTSVHEVWPGHFQQFLHSNRNPSKIAALWVGYAYAEGWAHYSEELMWEEGLGDGDAGAAHRAAGECAAARRALPVGDRAAHPGACQSPSRSGMFRERAFSIPATHASRPRAALTIRNTSSTPSASS